MTGVVVAGRVAGEFQTLRDVAHTSRVWNGELVLSS